MTSSPDLKDVVGDVNKDKSGLNSRKGSGLSPERSYQKNGTGLMRESSIDGKKYEYLNNFKDNHECQVVALF